MAGLAWYYLLAAMLNAAAAAYVAYMEMVSEGASRVGLAPETRRLPDWLVVAFFGLYGLATLLILGRDVSARGDDGRLRPLRPGQRAWWRSPRGPTRRTSPRSTTPGTARVARSHGPSLDDHHAGRRPRRADQPHALDPDLGASSP